MKREPRAWSLVWAVAAGLAGIAGLMTLELIEDPGLTPREILFELAEPTLVVTTAVVVAHLVGRMKRQHEEQLSLLRDLDVARSDGRQWRADMHDLLRGLGSAIDAQFDRWHLTAAEREVALLMLKGLSHKEIAIVRETSERTIRHQAQAIYGKANLSGRAALSAFFLEDLLLPIEQS
jgi:DNA-binding CsgD family transcriptional regulator